MTAEVVAQVANFLAGSYDELGPFVGVKLIGGDVRFTRKMSIFYFLMFCVRNLVIILLGVSTMEFLCHSRAE